MAATADSFVDFRTDTGPSIDAKGDSSPIVSVDAQATVVDAAGEHTAEVPPLPDGTVLYPNAEQGSANAECIAAAPAWLALVGTFLAEDQRCWADSDCTYVSFSDPCGMICPVPMNAQRIGEFGAQVYGYAEANCSTCPSPTSYPSCPAPRPVFCNAGRCEYRAD